MGTCLFLWARSSISQYRTERAQVAADMILNKAEVEGGGRAAE